MVTADRMPTIREETAADRILGYDVARAAAIAGMVVVHFAFLASGTARPAWLDHFVHEVLDGRAAATFMVLAGVGLTLLSRRAVASGDPGELSRARVVIRRRGWFLLVIGFVNLVFWPGDILRVYGIALLVAATLIDASDRRLLAAAGLSVAGFLVLFALLDYDKHWDWESLTYHQLWTADGILRNLFYDGFRSVFPWAAFVFYGMWLGRRNLLDPRTNRRFLVISVGIAAAAEIASRVAVAWLGGKGGWDGDEAVGLFGTISMPPLPVFLVAALSSATAVISLAVRLASMPILVPLLRPLAATGRLALTWYLGHIAVVLAVGTAIDMDVIPEPTLIGAVATGLGFFASAVAVSAVWTRFYRTGPLESAMRSMTG